jgi:SAM-dependent methyltransferase
MNQEFWEQFADADPLWAVLSDPSKRGRRWEVEPFFETGRREISLVLYQLAELSHPAGREAAFDFGCGVGRLTQALAEHFESVTGVDISTRMIELARSLNRHGDGVKYVHNTAANLAPFPSDRFDFIYSDIVLQHVAPEMAERYIREFLRILRPGGITVFQVPSHRAELSASTPRPVAMPDEAYRVGLSVPQFPSAMTTGEKATLLVRLVKLSNLAWPGTPGELRVGNHWLHNPGAQMLVQDDGRVPIPAGLAENDEGLLKLEITAPSTAGEYLCEVDAVHEGITWFRDRSGTSLRFAVTVTGESHGDRAPDPRIHDRDSRQAHHEPRELYGVLPQGVSEPGEFPMFGVHEDRVRSILEESGGTVFFQEPDDRGGPEWVGFRYFVRKKD